MSAQDAKSGAEIVASDEALRLAWVASHLHAVSQARFADFWEQQIGIALDWRKAWEASRGLQTESPWRDKRGRRPLKPESEQLESGEPALWEWMVADEPALGLLRVVYRLPNDGLPRDELREVLEELAGVRQVIELSSDREIIVVALTRDLEEAENLRAQIEDHAVGQSVRMDLVTRESHQPARRTWIELVRRELGLPSPE